jgi:hypothetical protein
MRRRGSHVLLHNRLANGGEIVGFTSQEMFWFLFLLEAVMIRSTEKSKDLIGNRTFRLEANIQKLQLNLEPLWLPKIQRKCCYTIGSYLRVLSAAGNMKETPTESIHIVTTIIFVFI